MTIGKKRLIFIGFLKTIAKLRRKKFASKVQQFVFYEVKHTMDTAEKYYCKYVHMCGFDINDKSLFRIRLFAANFPYNSMSVTCPKGSESLCEEVYLRLINIAAIGIDLPKNEMQEIILDALSEFTKPSNSFGTLVDRRSKLIAIYKTAFEESVGPLDKLQPSLRQTLDLHFKSIVGGLMLGRQNLIERLNSDKNWGSFSI